MAGLRSPSVGLLLVLSCCNFAFVANSAHARHARCPSVVFAFGDSLTDTGNGVRMFIPTLNAGVFQPYGRTYFDQATGRFSDGRVMIDCIVQSLGLPFLNPFLNFVGTDFSNGANYAVAASAALDYKKLAALGFNATTRYTLENQLQWHLTFLEYAQAGMTAGVTQFPTVSAISEGLYFICTGGIDLGNLYLRGIATEMLKNVTQLIMVKISETVQVLYEHGARNFLLTSAVPGGCMPSMKFASSDVDLDDRGCLVTVNNLSHNYSTSVAATSQLLSETLPNASVAFLDTYSAYYEILTHPDQYGIVDTQNACCAASTNIAAASVVNGYTSKELCGLMSHVCEDPNTFMNWDGMHYTDNTVRQAVNMFIDGKFIMPSDALSGFGAVPLDKAQISKYRLSYNSVIR